METVIAEKTVREIAIENPSSIRVFEALGIDYCCGGRRPLSEACASAGIDSEKFNRLLAATAAVSASPDTAGWNEKRLSELIAHVVERHHGFVRAETPRITGMLAKVAAKHGAAHPEVAEIVNCFGAMAQELASHMAKEEQILFPHIERLEQAAAAGQPAPRPFFGSVERPIATMMAEHDDAGALLARMRELSGGYVPPAGACPTFIGAYRGLEEFERDLHRHVHLENNILFPRAVELEQRA